MLSLSHFYKSISRGCIEKVYEKQCKLNITQHELPLSFFNSHEFGVYKGVRLRRITDTTTNWNPLTEVKKRDLSTLEFFKFLLKLYIVNTGFRKTPSLRMELLGSISSGRSRAPGMSNSG